MVKRYRPSQILHGPASLMPCRAIRCSTCATHAMAGSTTYCRRTRQPSSPDVLKAQADSPSTWAAARKAKLTSPSGKSRCPCGRPNSQDRRQARLLTRTAILASGRDSGNSPAGQIAPVSRILTLAGMRTDRMRALRHIQDVASGTGLVRRLSVSWFGAPSLPTGAEPPANRKEPR